LIASISEELFIFFATIYGGILIGLIYDLYRIFRRVFRPKKIATLVEDLIFWIVTGAAAFFVLLFSNDGELRFYTFLGFAIGAMLYIWALSPFVIWGITALLKLIKRIVLKLCIIILYPVRKIVLLLKKPWRWMGKKLRPIYLKIKRFKQLPRSWLKEMKKQVGLIIKKK